MTEPTETEVVYLGERSTTSGKLASLIIDVGWLRRLEESMVAPGVIERAGSLFTLKGQQKPQTVGAIYKIKAVKGDAELEDKIVSITGNPIFRGREDWRDQAEWEAFHHTEKRKLNAKAAEKKAATDTQLQRALDRLGRVYRQLPASNRAAFITYAIERIMKG